MAAQWGKLYGDLHDHPKMRRARKGGDRPRDASAIGLWVCAESWCIDNYHTDGWVPAEELDRWDSNAEALAQRLVDADLWIPTERDGEPGFQFWQWEEHQETAEKINAKRERNRLRMANARGGAKPKTPAKPKAAPKAKPDADDLEGWEEFWAAYPRKVSKASAQKAYVTALKNTTPEVVMRGLNAAVAAWKQDGQDPKFIPHAATWINGKRWEDEPLTDLAPAQASSGQTILRLCATPTEHPRHDWSDARNRYVCQGIQHSASSNPWGNA